MIASRTGVIAAWVIAVVLAAAFLLDARRDGPPDRALLAGFDAARVTALAWKTPDRAWRIERDSRSMSGWRWIDPIGEADRQAIDDVMAALRGGQWHRRVPAVDGDIATSTLVVEVGGDKTTIALGAPLGDEQRWVVIGEHALLVDAWVARAIIPDPIALRAQRPFAGIAQASEIEVASFKLVGTPRKVTKLAGLPIDLLADAGAVERLEQALGDLTIAAIPRGKIPVDTNFRGTRIGFGGKLVAVEAGQCPEPDRALRAILGPAIGPTCVTEAGWTAVIEAAAVFDVKDDTAGRHQSLAALVERRPVPLEPIGVMLSDGSTLELAKRPRVKDPTQPAARRDADPVRVAELLAVLATPAEPTPTPNTPAIGQLTITAARGVTIKLDLFAGGVVSRAGEPIALRLGEGSFALLSRPGTAYVDTTLWSEEPTTIRAIELGGTKLVRGAVVGEWTGTPDAAAAEALARLLASPRSIGDAAAPTNPRPVILSIAPPSGSPFERRLLLGAANGRPGAGQRCAATTTAGNVALDPQICALVQQLATSSSEPTGSRAARP